MERDEPSLAEMVQTALSRAPTERAIQYNGRWFDWAWVREVGDRVNRLLDEAGLGPGDTVAVAAANRPSLAAALLGLLVRERDIVMLYAYQSPEAIARKAREVKCSAILAAPDLWGEPMRTAAAETGAVAISVDEDGEEVLPGTRFDPAVDHRSAESSHGIALLTSGTTGPPKISHLPYVVLRRSCATDSPVHPYGTVAAPMTPPALHSSPFGNIAGLFAWVPYVIAGRSIILLEKFSMDAWLEYLREWRPVATGLPAPGYRMVLDAKLPPEVLEGVKYMSCGAAPLEIEVQREFEQTYGVKILLAYGATEFGGVIAAMSPQLREQHPDKLGSVGPAWKGVQIRVVDPVTREVLPAGQEGELEVQADRIGPHWIRTTDLAMIDEDGFLYHRGRTDGAIIRGGFKINPDVVRAALLEHPAISDAIVTGIADRRLGEVPVAAYKLKAQAAPPSVEELQAFLRGRLPATFLPARYRQVDELPLTTTQKLDMGAVKGMFAQEEQASKTTAGASG
jgi:long-chain acyl-CoA synthetase